MCGSGLVVLVDTDLRLGRPFCSVADLKTAVAKEIQDKHLNSRSTFGRGGFFARSSALLEKELEDDVRDRMRDLLSGRAADRPPQNTCSTIQAVEGCLLAYEEKTVCILFGMASCGQPRFVAARELTPQWLEAMAISSQPSIESLCDGKKPSWLAGAGAVLVLVADVATDKAWAHRSAAAAACLREATMGNALQPCPILWACCKTADDELSNCALMSSWRNLLKVWHSKVCCFQHVVDLRRSLWDPACRSGRWKSGKCPPLELCGL